MVTMQKRSAWTISVDDRVAHPERRSGWYGWLCHERGKSRALLAHPLGMLCTDEVPLPLEGPTRRGSPHPRGAGSFPRVLGHYPRSQALTMLQAIRKMTAFPASRVRLRGSRKAGGGVPADVTVFDPATVRDRADSALRFSIRRGSAWCSSTGTSRCGTASAAIGDRARCCGQARSRRPAKWLPRLVARHQVR